MVRSILRAKLAALVFVVALLQPWALAPARANWPSAPTAGPALQQTHPPEIGALAAGLEQDPLAIYDYVRNQIDYIPSWGLLKSPRETLLAGEGNPFDQAALLAALLESAGFAPQYIRGTIRITNQQAISWTGAADLDAAINILLAGGIQVTVEPTALQIPHVWVRINSGGSHDLDPSFKGYTEQAGQNLRSLLGLNIGALIARAEQGATITPTSARQLNLANLEADAAAAAANLASQLRAKTPFATVADLIGARRIVPVDSTSYPALPYDVLSSATAADLAAVSHGLTIAIGGITYTTTTDAIDGRRITLFYECATAADCQALAAGGGIFNVANPYTIDVVPRLRVGGELVGTGAAVPLGSDQQLDVSITTPAPGPQTFTFSRQLFAGGWYALPMRLQGVSGRGLSRQIALLDAAMSQGLPLDDEGVLGQILHVLGLAYFHEVGLGDRIDSRLAQVAVVPRFSVMVASRDILVFVDAQSRPAAIDPGAHSVDVGLSIDNAVALSSGAGAAALERAWFLSAGMRGSAIEHAILEQLLPSPAISTVQILRRAIATGDTLYYITPANKAAVLPLLDPAVAASVDPVVAADRHVVVAGDPVAYDEWSGTGWVELNPTTGEAGYIIAGGLNTARGAVPRSSRGGGGTRPQAPAVSGQVATHVATVDLSRQTGQATVRADDASVVSLQFRGQAAFDADVTSNQTLQQVMIHAPQASRVGTEQGAILEVADPVNAISGAFVERHQDLAPIGGLGPALEFARWYSSARHSLGGPLGYGWSHSYQGRFALGTEWGRSFGERTAIEAAPALAAAQIGLDLLNVASIPQQRFGMDAVVSAWLMAQVTDSAAVITEPEGAVAAYVRLVDGSYMAPELVGNLGAVSIAGDGSASVTWEDGRRGFFNPAGSPTAIEDANGNRVTLSYNAQGRLSQVRDAVGRTLTLSYNAQGRLSQVADPAGRVYTYAYDGQGNLKTATSPRGAVTAYAYDAGHRITSIADPLGAVYVQSQYDALGRISSQVNGRGAQTRLLYAGDHTIVTDPVGARSSYFYDDRGRLTRFEDGLGASRSLTYDAAGHLLGLTNGLGQSLSFSYDSRGRLTTMADPLHHTMAWAYDAAGNLTSFTDQAGAQWTFTYDARHNLTRATDPTGVVTQYSYGPKGQLTTLRDVVGATTLTYDAHGNLRCVRDALAHTRCWEYDGLGRPTSVTDGTGVVTRFQYDAHDNLVRLTAPGGGQTSYSYDLNDSLTGLTDANGHTTSYAYDSQLNLARVTDALGGVTSYQYDLADRLARVTDANGHATNYQYDAAGRLTGAVDPLGRSQTLGYDDGDRLTAWTRADGSLIQYGFDALGRLTGIDTSAGPDSSFSYDAAGRIIAAQSGGWGASYTYDAAGRLKRSDEAGRSLATIYSYDAVGRRAGLRVERGGAALYDLAYSYDVADRLIGVTDRLSDPDSALELRYDAADRLTEISSPSGAQTAYSYSAGRLSQIRHASAAGAALATYAYAHDALGNIVTATETTAATGAFATTYTYDALNRLTREQYPRYAIAYSYDAVGNLTRRADALGAVDYSYDSANQLIARGAESFAYDLNGNLTGRQSAQGTTSYSYDGHSRLTELTRSDGTNATFAYDPFGRRIGAGGAAGVSEFLYDGFDLILGGGASLAQPARYLHADGLLLARQAAATGLTTYHGDAGEHVRYLQGASGQPLDGYSYDAYGRPGAPAGIDPNLFRFGGLRGVYSHSAGAWPELQMGYRYYIPDVGRFLTTDPLPGLLRQPLSQNSQAYALGNPVTNNDTCGLRPNRIRMDTGTATSIGGLRQRALSSLISMLAPVFPRLRPEAQIDHPSCRPSGGQGSGLSTVDAVATEPSAQPMAQDRPASPSLDAATPAWQRLIGQGGFYALACSASNELLAGSFHAGLARSAADGHGDWTSASSSGVSALALAGTSFAGGPRVGVLKSANATTWAAANAGLAANDVYALAIEPGATGRVVAGTEMGLFVSANGGASWGRPVAPVPGRVVSEVAFAGAKLLAVTDQGLFVGTTSGGSWQRASGLPAAPVYTLITASQATTVYAGTAMGVYRSTNGGSAWAALGSGLGGHPVYALAIDPQNIQRIAAGTGSGLFLSTNGGATWTRDSRPGLTGSAAQIGALAFCPRGGDQELYVGSGAGVHALEGQRYRIYTPIQRR